MRGIRRSVFCLSFLVLAPAAWAQVRAGGEFVINTVTTGNEMLPVVTVEPGGAFLVSWFNQAGAPTVVDARRFDRQGVPQGLEFQVNSPGTSHAREPVVAADEKGRVAIAWSNELPSLGVFARVFDKQGAGIGSEFRVSAGTDAVAPDVAAVPGGFVTVWNTYGGDVVARRFDVRGNVRGPQLVVNTYTTGGQYDAAVAGRPDGGFVVVWTNGYPAPPGVFARRFDAADMPVGNQFRVNSSTGAARRARMASDDAGNFVVAWLETEGGTRLLGRRFDASGTPQGAEFVVTTFAGGGGYYLAVAADRTGEFVVAWETYYGDGSNFGVFARRFTRGGAPRGPAFAVNTYTTSFQALPDIASDGSGNLVAVWMSSHLGQGNDAFGQRFGGLLPAGLTVVDGDNQVLEAGDSFQLSTSWRNVNGVAQTFQGRSADVQVPAGLELTLSADASYGTVPSGAAGSCSGACFAGSLSGKRPGGDVDATFVESILPDAQGQRMRWRLHVGDSFNDVPRTSPFYRFVETVLHHRVTGGCGPGLYCPDGATTRQEIAVFLLLAKEGAGYVPPACATPAFGDVPASSPFCRWIEELARRGVTGGCGGGNFCPLAPVTREQMAVFILRTLDPTLEPPACTVPMFDDVPVFSPFCRWIEELARRGVVGGCASNQFCPTAAVTREQMSVFVTVTFGLTLYGP